MGSQRIPVRQSVVGEPAAQTPSPQMPIGACRCLLTASEATVLAVLVTLAASISWTYGIVLMLV